MSYTNKSGTRGQASKGIPEHYADRSVSETVSQLVNRPRVDVKAFISFEAL